MFDEPQMIRSAKNPLRVAGLTPRGWRLSPLVLIGVLALIMAGAPLWVLMARGPESVADIAEDLQDAVVNISTTQTVKGQRGIPLPQVPKGSPFEEFFDDLFNKRQQKDLPRFVNSLGSGFVIDASGLIVTNNHVIEGADEIIINMNDGSRLPVTKIVGRDPKTDLAVLKIEPKKPLHAITFGDSSTMRVGDWVMAIGNPFGLGGTVTVGIISAMKRDINAGPYDEFLQTDAAINRGNSGGPLFNMQGQVIGVNTAIISPTGGSIGIGFAIPATTATHVIDQLRQFGETRRGWLGVRIQTVTDEIADNLGMTTTVGALVASIKPGSPAEQAGLKTTDVITRFDNQDVAQMRGLPRIVARTPIGKEVDIDVLRNGKVMRFRVRVGRLPEGETPAVAEKSEEKKSPEGETMLGLSIASLSDELRDRYGISKKVHGVVIIAVDPASDAAKNDIKAGQVIVEVAQQKVQTPKEMSVRLKVVQKEGGKTVLLLLSDANGDDLHFVLISIKG